MIDGPIKLGTYRVGHYELLSVRPIHLKYFPNGGIPVDKHFLILNRTGIFDFRNF